MAESLAPGAVGRRVALRHGVHPNQLYAWRRAVGSAGGPGLPDFVPVVTSAGIRAKGPAGVGLEIEVAGMIVRVAPGVDPGFLGTVLRAAKMA